MRKKLRKKDPFADREAQNYERPIASREFLLELITENNRPMTFKQFYEALRLTTAEDQEALRRRLSAMVRDGQLLQNRRGAYGLIEKMEMIKGHVIGHKDGFGFVVPENGGDDIFLNSRQMRMVLPNDIVLVRIAGLDHRGRPEGKVVEVLEHHTKQLVGRFFTEAGTSFVEPSNQRITQEIFIPAEHKGEAVPGQIVIVQLLEQPTLHSRAIGKIIEVLGEHMAPGMEIDVAIRNHELPHEWPSAVLAEAGEFNPEIPTQAFKDRLDLRHLPFVTIDGEDAKDFDDAVYCEGRPRGSFVLYVAIADVAHYVTPQSALDKEAYNRGNSVYFPGRVIPMLPEILSNELCSLKAHVDRLTMVCEMAISATGKIEHFHFHNAVIRSHARLTYNQVYAMIEKNDLALRDEYAKLLSPLNQLFVLYRLLQAARKKRGAIDFDMPEPKIIFGVGRKIERIIALERNDAHRLIEECMLCANICAARFILKNKAAGLFRVHEGPTHDKLTDLRKFLGELGLKLAGGETPSPNDYATLLAKVAARADAHMIQTVLLRSLSQAVYSPENKGHFGLAYDAYTHFTSPIRRYPDLIVHRTLKNILQNQPASEDILPKLQKYGDHSSMTERRADDATREAIDWLKCEYMMDKIGEEFLGIITNVTGFGFFVELKEIYVEGLVHISLLRNDYYHFDAVKHALFGEQSGQQYRLGDSVKVKVVRVDLDQRQIDFILADDVVDIKTKKNGKSKKEKPKTRKNKRKNKG